MISLQRYVPARIALALASFTAVAVGFTWALATGMVVNHPATILFQIDFTGRGDSGETVTSIRVEAFPEGSAYAAAMEQGGGPGLRSIPLVVDGGDPGIPTDAGVAYETRVFGYFARPQGTSYLRIIRTEPITLDNNPGS